MKKIAGLGKQGSIGDYKDHIKKLKKRRKEAAEKYLLDQLKKTEKAKEDKKLTV